MTLDYLEIEDDQHRRNTAALEAAQIGVFEFEPKSSRAFWDDRVRDLWGAGPDEEIDYAYVISRVHEEDRDYHNRETQKALDPGGNGKMDIEYRLTERENQSERWIRAKARTLFVNGEAVRLVGTVEDITTRKLAQLRNKLLLRELQHRLKNTLSVVNAVVQTSHQQHQSASDFAESLKGRIFAMSYAQELLQKNDWQDVWLSEICETVMSRLLGSTDRIDMHWENDLLIPEQYVLTSSIAIHELTTNSMKYGALSDTAGSVTLSGSRSGASERFEWRECGGPEVVSGPFPANGFGSVLLCEIWPEELNGTSTYFGNAQGAVFQLSLEGVL